MIYRYDIIFKQQRSICTEKCVSTWEFKQDDSYRVGRRDVQYFLYL